MSVMRFSPNRLFYGNYDEQLKEVSVYESDTNKKIAVVLKVVSLEDADKYLEKKFEELELKIESNSESLLDNLISNYKKYPCDINKKYLKTFYFLLKKMEYTNKKVFKVDEILKRFDEIGITIEKGFNPFE